MKKPKYLLLDLFQFWNLLSCANIMHALPKITLKHSVFKSSLLWACIPLFHFLIIWKCHVHSLPSTAFSLHKIGRYIFNFAFYLAHSNNRISHSVIFSLRETSPWFPRKKYKCKNDTKNLVWIWLSQTLSGCPRKHKVCNSQREIGHERRQSQAWSLLCTASAYVVPSQPPPFQLPDRAQHSHVSLCFALCLGNPSILSLKDTR